ncbi:MAG: response regulator [Proteobacteria bacterium]|nr:response regulator [Pseudomonadota bacterium]
MDPQGNQQIETSASEEAWHFELESAIRPFPRFVEEICAGLAGLESVQEQLIRDYENRLQELEEARARAVFEAGTLVETRATPKRTVSSRERASSRSLEPRKILLVDDAELSRVLVSHYLRGLPVRVDFAPTLQDAVSACSGKKYDLLLVDYELKGTEPVSLAAALKPHGRLVALASGSGTAEEESSAVGNGFELVLSRGLPKDEMIDSLSRALWGAS